MTKADRIRNVLRGEQPDRIPWGIWPSYLIRSSVELELRNKGLGLYFPLPVHQLDVAGDVRMEDDFITEPERTVRTAKRTYYTAKGAISSSLEFKYKPAFHVMFAELGVYPPGFIPSEGISQHGHDVMAETGSDKAEGLAPRKYFFKKDTDYDVIREVIEHTVLEPSYGMYNNLQNWLGGEGVPMAVVWNSPFQALLSDWMGPKRCCAELEANGEKFRALYATMVEKDRELFRIIADSPASEVWIGDHVSADTVTPAVFEAFYAPYYNEIADFFHNKGKIVGCRVRGNLKALAPLIGGTKLDFIEAFSPAPEGDMTCAEARDSWPDKTILCNFPGTVLVRGEDEIRAYAKNMLEEIAPGDRFMVVTATSFPPAAWRTGFPVLADVLAAQGAYPVAGA